MAGKGKITFCLSNDISEAARKMSMDTVYNGNKYRSRLEARFAVFLDELGIKHKYEPIKPRFLGGNIYYMPDFLIDMPVVLVQNTRDGETLVTMREKVYVEVKGEMTKADMQKIERFQMVSTDYPLWVVGGVPDQEFFKNYTKDMRPDNVDSLFPIYSCGMAGWYDTGVVMCRSPYTKQIGLVHHGIGVRLENIGADNYTINGSKSWFDGEIQRACDIARMKRFETYSYKGAH